MTEEGIDRCSSGQKVLTSESDLAGRGEEGGRKNNGDIREAQGGTVVPFWKGSHGEPQLEQELT